MISDTRQGWRTWVLFIFFGNSPESLTWDDATIRHNLCELWDKAERSTRGFTPVDEGAAIGSEIQRLTSSLTALRGSNDALRVVVDHAEQMVPQALVMLKRENFVFRRFPRDIKAHPPVSEEERWEALAFSLYSRIGEVSSMAVRALNEVDELSTDPLEHSEPSAFDVSAATRGEGLNMAEQFMVGDIISMPGPHPTLPKELERKYFRVEAVDERGVKLSRPYVDAKCTIPYRAIPPVRT
jgi:hypothetical protein